MRLSHRVARSVTPDAILLADYRLSFSADVHLGRPPSVAIAGRAVGQCLAPRCLKKGWPMRKRLLAAGMVMTGVLSTPFGAAAQQTIVCPGTVGGSFNVQAPRGFSPDIGQPGWGNLKLAGAQFSPGSGPRPAFLSCKYATGDQPYYVSGNIERTVASNCVNGNSNWTWQGPSGWVCGAGLQTDPAACPVSCPGAAAVSKQSSRAPRVRRQR